MAVDPLRNPISGIAGCCAREVNGNMAAPPRMVMNSRLLTDWPSGRGPHSSTSLGESSVVHRGKMGCLLTAVGLGCVKTRRRGEPIEWTFRQIAISAVRILERSQFRSIRERSFSSFSSFRGFHTAWVKTRTPLRRLQFRFRQLRTCLPHWLGPLSANSRLVQCNQARRSSVLTWQRQLSEFTRPQGSFLLPPVHYREELPFPRRSAHASR
jgi:hypothetical protein